jgi:hypothetical protein
MGTIAWKSTHPAGIGKRIFSRLVKLYMMAPRGQACPDERDDRIVRDEVEFLEKWQYIMNNPVKAELAERPEEYPWLYIKNG